MALARSSSAVRIVLPVVLSIGAVGVITLAATSNERKDQLFAMASKAEMAGSSAKSQFDSTLTSVMLTRLGLSPEALAAADLDNRDQRSIINAALIYFHAPENITQIQEATAAVNRAAQRATRADAEDPRISLGDAQAQLDAAMSSALDAIMLELTPTKQQALRTLRANQRREVPIQYRLATLTDEEWLALRHALSEQRLAQRRGQTLVARHADTLSRINTRPDVSAANRALEQRRTGARETWAQLLPRR